jgi:hypothetical protein
MKKVNLKIVGKVVDQQHEEGGCCEEVEKSCKLTPEMTANFCCEISARHQATPFTWIWRSISLVLLPSRERRQKGIRDHEKEGGSRYRHRRPFRGRRHRKKGKLKQLKEMLVARTDRPALARSRCEVALFNEPPSGQIGCALLIRCAAYSFDVANHDVLVCSYVRF